MENRKHKKITKVKSRLCINPFSPLFGLRIKKYLSALEIEAACKRCIEEYFRLPDEGDENRFDLFENVQMAFDVIVATVCTDVYLDVVTYDELVESGIMHALRRKVKNYDMAWAMIRESLALKNTYAGLNLVARMIPNPEAMDRSVDEMGKMIRSLRDKDPESFTKLISAYAMSAQTAVAREQAKKDK